MVKKGQSSKGGPKPGTSAGKNKASTTPAADDSFIVFSNSDKEPKQRKPPTQGQDGPDPLGEAPKRPDVKKLIGGQSWTGKLPVNLLSEHCQKQRWEKPEYTMVSVFMPWILQIWLQFRMTHTDAIRNRVKLRKGSPQW